MLISDTLDSLAYHSLSWHQKQLFDFLYIYLFTSRSPSAHPASSPMIADASLDSGLVPACADFLKCFNRRSLHSLVSYSKLHIHNSATLDSSYSRATQYQAISIEGTRWRVGYARCELNAMDYNCVNDCKGMRKSKTCGAIIYGYAMPTGGLPLAMLLRVHLAQKLINS